MSDNYFLLTNLLSEDERKVITSIMTHIKHGEKRVGIQQIAAENYLSTASIVKMCKRLGFDGYTTLSAVVLQRGIICADGVYNVENLHVRGRALKTNTTPAALTAASAHRRPSSPWK